MAKKSSSRNALKSLFSRSEANLEESAEKSEGEKKKFKFLKFKSKSKKVSAEGGRQVLSAVEASNAATDGETWADGIVVKSKDRKGSSLSATAPRSKSKEFSYSELDLRKPKRFATFSFGLGKRKKKDEESVSKSVAGLHNSDIEERQEAPPDLRHVELNRANAKTLLSVSQPELDSDSNFNIPSPPSVAANKPDFHRPARPRSPGPAGARSRVTKPPTDVRNEARAPIASIPELQLDDDPALDPPAHGKPPAPAGSTGSTCAVSQTAARRPAVEPEASDRRAPLVDSVSTSAGPRDTPVPQQSDAETYRAESTSVALSHRHPDDDDAVDGSAPSGEPNLTGVGSKTDAAVSHDDTSASVHHKSSASLPETAQRVSVTAAAVGGEQEARPVNQDAVYGELYESLFPRSFTCEGTSSSFSPPAQIYTEIRRLKLESESVAVEARDEVHADVLYSRLATSRESAAGSSDATDPDNHHKYLSSLSSASKPVGPGVGYSALSLSHSQVKSDTAASDLVHENVSSVPVVKNSAPPVSDCGTPRGTDSHITDSKRRVILVKELVTDETDMDPACPPDKTSAAIKLKAESFSGPPGRVDGCGGFLSPAYLSVGSDDGSAAEVYYSAEEDNATESEDEEMFTVDEREDKCVGDGVKGERLCEEERQTGRRREVVIIKVQSEDDEEKTDVLQTETQQNVRSQTGETRVHKSKEDEEVYTADGRRDERVGDGVDGERLREEQQETVEKREGDLKVVIIKMQSEDDEEKTKDVNFQSETAETPVHKWKEAEEVYAETDGVGEERLCEEQVEVAEGQTGKRREVVIIKTQSEDDEEKTEDADFQSEAQQNVGSRTAETLAHKWKEGEEVCTADGRRDERVGGGVGGERLREEQVEVVEKREGDLKVVIIKMQSEDDEETQRNAGGQTAETRVPKSKEDKGEDERVGDGVKERQLCEEQIIEGGGGGGGGGREMQQTFGSRTAEALVHKSKEDEMEITERQGGEKREGDLKVVIIKMQSEDDEEKTEDVDFQSDTQQHAGGQTAEGQTHKTAGSEFVPSSDAKTSAFPEREDGGEGGNREELLAAPVLQVNTLMECSDVPPSAGPRGEGEGSEGAKQLETEAHLRGGAHFLSRELRYVPHGDPQRPECAHAASGNSRRRDVITPTSREAGEQVSLSAHKSGGASDGGAEGTGDTAAAASDAPAGTDVSPQRAELRSRAREVAHSGAPRRSQAADTVAPSADGEAEREQVSVKPSIPDTRRPDSEAAEARAESHERPRDSGAPRAEERGTLSTTAETDASASGRQQVDADEELLDKMSAGYSSLSTKLSIKNMSPPRDNDESKHRVRKVSLVKEPKSGHVSQDSLDFSETRTEVSNGTRDASEYKWKNSFGVGVAQYKSSTEEDFPLSDSYRVSDSYSSTSSLSSSLSSTSSLPEAPGYKYLSSTLPSPSPSAEDHVDSRSRDGADVYLSRSSEPAGEPRAEWRRSSLEREELSAPARGGEERREAETERIGWDSAQLPASSALRSSCADESDDTLPFTGVFKATFVELVSDPPASPTTPPASPDTESSSQFDMDNLVDTLKNMGPPLRTRGTGPRVPPPVLVSSLPPIIEDAPNPASCIDVTDSLRAPTNKPEPTGAPAEPGLRGIYTLPADLGLRSVRDTRSPLELMKTSQQEQQQPSGSRGLMLPLRDSSSSSTSSSSIALRKSSDSATDELKSPVLNGNGSVPSSITGSRLEKSVLFRNYRSSSIDLTQENGKTPRPLLHTNSLPESGPSNNRMSELGTGTEQAGSRFERLSFLLNSSSMSSSLTGAEDLNARANRPPSLGIASPPSSNSPTRLLSPTGSLDLHRPFPAPDSSLSMFGQTPGLGLGAGTGTTGPPILQRSFSGEHAAGVQQPSLFSSMLGGSAPPSQKAEPDRNLTMKYRAFPDAYLTKEKKHGKLNPRPGKMYIFDQPGMCGQRIEVRSDVIDATAWNLQETISIRVVRGGWVLYEKPNFKGEKFALDEGDIELPNPFGPPEEQVENGPKEAEEQNGAKPARRFIIGSVRRAVRDYSVPEICLFPEENAEGKKVIFRDTSDDARIFGFPIKANSIIINAGLWLVFAQPFFQGVPRVLEVGGYSNPAAWGVEQPYVGSLHPLKVGEPVVEYVGEPKVVIYDKPYFSGKSRTISTDMRDFMSRTDRQQAVYMFSVGSLKVLGGVWVGYEKEGFRGHQYLLEEGEYHDWRVWGGCDAELRSVRVIRADLTDPLMVMMEQPEEEEQADAPEENSFEVTEAVPDVELFGYRTSTRSIHVLSGAWIAYSHVDFSGNQFVLEKGFYSNCADWGSEDTRICSVQPIRQAPGDQTRSRNEILLYSEPDFQGECHVFDRTQDAVPEKLTTKSCRVAGGSWVLYENNEHCGNLYVLSEGEYPNLTSMGCPPHFTIRSLKIVPMTFCVPSISLFGLECLEGREITTSVEIVSMVEEGYNNHILSVKVNSGCWVICEHSNYRGRQFLLEPVEITSWPTFSSLHTIGSVYPVRQKRQFFRIKNRDRGHFMSVQGGVEELKTGRVVVTPEVEPMSDVWYYQDGFIKNKLSPTMSLQVMSSSNVEAGSKVVLWTETRQPIQTWTAQTTGLITSITFPGLVLDVKGGKTYDKDHMVVMSESEERPSQQWEIELL